MKNITILLLFALALFNPSFVSAQSHPSQKHVFVYKTVEGHDIKANIFLPPTNNLHPVLIYFHGGGFIFGNKNQGLDAILRDKLLANNYAVVSANYRLAPETKLEVILEDVSDVIKWVRTNGQKEFNLDVNKIAVAGGSAGGYLALSSGFKTANAPDAIIAISTPTGFSTANIGMGDLSVLDQPGPYDVVSDSIVSHGDYSGRMELWRFLERNRLALYEIFGFDPSAEPKKLEAYTLTANVKPEYPPTLLMHARNDHLVDLAQVQAFYDFLQGKHIASKLYLVNNGHSSELLNQHPEAVDEIIAFLNERLGK